MKIMLLSAALAVSAVAPVIAQRSAWDHAERITIAMTDHGFLPRQTPLRRAAPYVLRIVNRSGKGHNFTQKVFFRLALVAPSDRGYIRGGQISLRPGEGVTIRLRAPDSRPGGTYEFGSTTLGDAVSDYKGVFVMQ